MRLFFNRHAIKSLLNNYHRVPTPWYASRQAIVFGLLLFALPFVGAGCAKQPPAKPVTLQYWRVFDDQDTVQDIISKYRASHPNITINYKKIRYEEYENELLNAWAEDRGPDIFSIHNTWIGKYQSKITPLPKTTTLAYQYIGGTIKKEVVTETRTTPTITTAQIREKFVDVVPGDVIRPGTDREKSEQIFGLPLSVDTLVLYYNKDILNKAGIATAPDNWQTFLQDVAAITKTDDAGNIAVAGAALGTAKNIPRFSDILAVLMMQNGATMADSNGFPAFQRIPSNAPNKNYNPGLRALEFYADFANQGKQAYSWNDQMPNALEAFTQGRVAFYFGYAYNLPTINNHPELRWGVAPIPQADAENNRVNFANYWVETVSKKTTHQNEAWDFIQFAAKKEQAATYLKKAQKPTALRALIEEQKNDPLLAPFASELLTAKSWYKGRDVGLAEEALADMVIGTSAALVSEDKGAFARLVSTTVQRIAQSIQ